MAANPSVYVLDSFAMLAYLEGERGSHSRGMVASPLKCCPLLPRYLFHLTAAAFASVREAGRKRESLARVLARGGEQRVTAPVNC